MGEYSIVPLFLAWIMQPPMLAVRRMLKYAMGVALGCKYTNFSLMKPRSSSKDLLA